MRKYARKLVRSSGALLRSIFNLEGDWEGGMRHSTKRGRVGRWFASILSPNDTNDQISRTEAIRKTQHFERNNSIVNRILDVYELFTVGAGGMPIVPDSSDEKWNARAKEQWARWCQIPDLTSRLSFAAIQKLYARRTAADGRCLIYLTASERPPYYPRIQIFEATQLQTPDDMHDRADIIDGIQIDEKGRPIFYYIRTGPETFKKINADSIIDSARPMRPGELHPMPMFAPCLADIQDLNELGSFAMQNAKKIAIRATVMKTESGELPTADDQRSEIFDQTTQTAAGTDYEEQRMRSIEQAVDTKLIALKTTEELKQLGAETPNQIEQAHWDIIVNRICAGFGISKLLVFPNSMQGTVVRADLDICNTFFRSHSEDYAEAFRRVYEYVIDQLSRIEISIADKPADWRRCRTRAPRGCNVDVGRNSTAMLAELAVGANNFDLIYGQLGLDADEELKSGINKLAKILKWCEDAKVPPAMFNQAFAAAFPVNPKPDSKDQIGQEDAEWEQIQKQAA